MDCRWDEISIMNARLSQLLNFNIGLSRVKADIADAREFVRHPNELDLVRIDEAAWLKDLQQKVAVGYVPSAAVIADVPKGSGGIRPAALLTLEDRVVYASALAYALPQIHSALAWSQGTVDFAYRLVRSAGHDWFGNQFTGWSDFRRKSVDLIAEGIPFVVITDVTGFYENIALQRLASDLNQMGIDGEIISLLSKCLNLWAQVEGRGIPQGNSASDVLAKVYLNPTDHQMIESGFTVSRYVDDIRIFCTSDAEAKRALIVLTQSLRRRGLNLQAAKTKMLVASDAIREIDGVIPHIEAARDSFIREVREMAGEVNPYLTLEQSEQLIEIRKPGVPIENLRNQFQAYFMERSIDFDKSLFHFLLNRLGNHGDNFAADYCLSILSEHPEETGVILSYLEKIGVTTEHLLRLEQFLRSEEAVYEYQVYQILEFAMDQNAEKAPGLLSLIRQIAFDRGRPDYLRAVARVVIGKLGTVGDLELIEASFATAAPGLDRAQVLCALGRMERGRRNGFLARTQGSDQHCARAANFVRQTLG